MPEWIAVIILGVIEGVTEFLPVSSTGHLLIAERWLPRQTDLFNIVIQTGAVVAVLPLFRERIASVLSLSKEGLDYAAKVGVAFVITAVGGLALDSAGFRLPEDLLPVALALLIGGILFLVVEAIAKRKQAHGHVPFDDVTWTIAIAVGLAQLVAAVFPGTSRSGSTILIMLLLGLTRVAATEFTFLVGIPTIMAGGGYKVLKAFKGGTMDQENWPMVGLGFVVSAIVSFVVVKWLLRYVQHHTFVAFGWYRIVFGAALLAAVAFLPHEG
jgi:undecaprenyl-diphosphatase